VNPLRLLLWRACFRPCPSCIAFAHCLLEAADAVKCGGWQISHSIAHVEIVYGHYAMHGRFYWCRTISISPEICSRRILCIIWRVLSSSISCKIILAVTTISERCRNYLPYTTQMWFRVPNDPALLTCQYQMAEIPMSRDTVLCEAVHYIQLSRSVPVALRWPNGRLLSHKVVVNVDRTIDDGY
jgi:hypothetical protein